MIGIYVILIFKSYIVNKLPYYIVGLELTVELIKYFKTYTVQIYSHLLAWESNIAFSGDHHRRRNASLIGASCD